MKKVFLPWMFCISLFISSCTLDPSQSSGTGGGVMLPNVSGSAGEVLIVMDNNIWKSTPGLSLKEILEQEYPALPQPEPLFDIIHITPGAFDDLFKRHRTIIIADVSSENESPEISYLENLWAKPQLVIRINAAKSEDLFSLIHESKERILYNIQVYDRRRLSDIFRASRDAGIRSILNRFYINLAVPRGYQIDIDAENFAMFSIETARTSQVICVYRFPYYGESDLSTSNLIQNRDDMMKIYTQGARTGSHMITSPMFPVMVYDIQRDGKKLIEMRGLWELNKGFMGGPFISHTYVDKTRQQLITVEGYVYNPNQKKRNMMRHIEAVLYSMEIL